MWHGGGRQRCNWNGQAAGRRALSALRLSLSLCFAEFFPQPQLWQFPPAASSASVATAGPSYHPFHPFACRQSCWNHRGRRRKGRAESDTRDTWAIPRGFLKQNPDSDSKSTVKSRANLRCIQCHEIVHAKIDDRWQVHLTTMISFFLLKIPLYNFLL